jgi:hypothetical protein
MEVVRIEFSPDGNYVYITHHVTALQPFPFKIYDVAAQDFTLPSMISPAFVNQIDDYQYSRIELASDGKLYMANATGYATLSNSNDPSNLSWSNTALPFSYNLSMYGYPQGTSPVLWAFNLPDQIDGMDYSNLPGAPISVAASATSICQGAPVILTATGSSNYTWTSSTGGTYSGSPLTVYPNANTTYTVSGGSGSCASAPESITINVNPNPAFSLGPNIALCSGDPFPSLCPTGQLNRGDSYSWSGPGIVPGTVISSCYQPTQFGYYCLTVTNSLGCSTTHCIDISENLNSSYDSEFTLNVSCYTGSPVTITSTYVPLPVGMTHLIVVDEWNGIYGSNFMYIGTNFDLSTHPFVQGITYRIRRHVHGTCFPSQLITHYASCEARRGSFNEGIVKIDSEIVSNELSEAIAINTYPNPNNGQFTIELSNTEGSASVQVYDMVGKLVYSANSANGIQKIDISDQPKGMYLVKVTSGKEVFTEKVIYQ